MNGGGNDPTSSTLVGGQQQQQQQQQDSFQEQSEMTRQKQNVESQEEESPKDRALREAKECLEALRVEGTNIGSGWNNDDAIITSSTGFQLEGFNLLGVVANPRYGGSSSSSSFSYRQASSSTSSSPQKAKPTAATTATTTATTTTSSSPSNTNNTTTTTTTTTATPTNSTEIQQQTQQATQPLPPNQELATTTSSLDFFGGTVQSLEYTLQQVTEQIDNLNLFLEELSRHCLGDDAGESVFLEYYLQYEQEQMEPPPIPPQLANLQLQSLQAYLEECGVLAHKFFVVQPKEQTTTTTNSTNNNSNSNSSSTLQQEGQSSGDSMTAMAIATIQDCEDLPDVLVQSNFDLTNPTTFMQLLMGDSTSSTTTTNNTIHSKATSPSSSDSLYQPTNQLVPLASQDSLAGHLDKVELALQAQVRSKAGAFFQETTRFSELQVLIVRLLDQVQTLRFQVQQMKASYAHVADIATLDLRRQEYQTLLLVLDATMELVRCKASIGGLVSAGDHLGAAEQIQFGRQLLLANKQQEHEQQQQQQQPSESNRLENGDAVDTSSEESIELNRLVSLGTCSDQFEQYETLVIQNLSEELVELFLGWNATSTSSTTTSSIKKGGLGAADEARVAEMVQALELCNALSKTGQLYVRRTQQVIRMTVRTTIAEFVVDSGGVTGMTYSAFSDCLAMLLEELQVLLRTAHSVDEFCIVKHLFQKQQQNQQQGDVSSQQATTSSLQEPATTEPTKSTTATTSSSRWTYEAMTSAAELAAKSVAELLRLRKEAHSLITLDEMKQLWDRCLQFTLNVEQYSGGTKAIGLRSTLLGQARAFLERTHEANMAALVAALDSERWTQCDVSPERQAVLTRLCSGRAVVSTMTKRMTDDNGDSSSSSYIGNNTGAMASTGVEKKPTAEVEGVRYKVVWSCLLLVEMIMTNLSAAAHFQSLATNAVAKVAELLRLFNARTTTLVLGAGAIHSAARLKSINAKHLSLVTQCLGMILALFPHIRAALMAQLPAKQHTLLADLDKIKKDFVDHNENVLNKFVTIIGGIVEHGLAPRIANTDFDSRAAAAEEEKKTDDEEIKCCVFLEGVSSNTKKMHQVLKSHLPPDHLQDVFSRIFAYVDQKVPALLIAADAATAEKWGNGFVNNNNERNGNPSSSVNGNAANALRFRFPTTDKGKRRLLLEVETMTRSLNGLDRVIPWDFTAMTILGRELDYRLPVSAEKIETAENVSADPETTSSDSNKKESEDGEQSETAVVVANGDGHETDNAEKDDA